MENFARPCYFQKPALAARMAMVVNFDGKGEAGEREVTMLEISALS